MYEKETYEVILERMLGRISDKLDKRPSSVIYDTHSATAVELQILYIELEYLIKNSYGDTAAREYLILLAKDRGIVPKPASKAILRGEFTPAQLDVTGRRFSIDGVNYVVTQRIESGQYQVQCETAGSIGNRYLGQLIPVEYINGLQTAELTEILIPGEDEEDTETLRRRYFDSFNEKSFGGNRADYLGKVRSISGVGGVKVTRVWNGDLRPADMIPSAAVTQWVKSVADGLDETVAGWLSAVHQAASDKKLTIGGSVLITIVQSDAFKAATQDLLHKVQDMLDPDNETGEGAGLAPIGHMVKVQSASEVPVNVTTNIAFQEGYSWSNLREPIKNAVDAYLLELRKEWEDTANIVVRISQIESRILAVNGVADITDTRLNGNSENLKLGAYEVPVIGGVSE